MKELNDIIQAYDKAVVCGKQTALVTVVKVEGSSYRRPGSRMLVTEEGEITGAISGGCLEGDALRKALLAISRQQNKLEIYDTTDEDDAKLGVQLGCNGIVYILFEPIVNNNALNPLALLKNVARHRKEAVLVTAFNEDKNAHQPGTCCFINDKEKISLTNESKNFIEEAITVLEHKNSFVKSYSDCSVLYQFVPPTIQLIIAGAGNDALPLVDMAALLGWQTVVVDGRPTHATKQRFYKAGEVIVAKPCEALAQVCIHEQTAFVLMTHNYNYDLALLSQLLSFRCTYIGVLGPKNKLQRMVTELEKNGVAVTDEQIHSVYGPVGLDIGAETAEEIAVSIIAEIKAVLAGRKGTLLKDRPFAIHSRLIEYE